MKVSYTSDIHLEFLNFPDFSKETSGDVLILNGDILVAPYLEPQRTDKEALRVQKYLKDHFIPELIKKYKTVLYLAGNHEFYRSDINTGLQIIQNWFKDQYCDNMIFMENDHLDINSVRFIGSTLWSDFFGADPVAMWEAGRGMNDFRLIKNGKYIFTPEKALDLHKVSRQYIEMLSDTDMQVVVLTHHTPTNKLLNPYHSGNLLDGVYYTDLSGLIEKRPNIKYWVSGHTHAIGEYEVYSTKCVSNCRGYYTEKDFKNWTGLKHFEV